MAPHYTLSIPTTKTSPPPDPHTVYTIQLQLPLQTLSIPKRYSDFLTLHSQLTSQAGTAPPLSPPPKTYLALPSFLGGSGTSTIHNPALVEKRRQALETYVQKIADENEDPRWRDTSAWRTFLNLPSSSSGSGAGRGSRSAVAKTGISGGGPSEQALASDPGLWLDTHRECKTLLQEARKHVSARAAEANGNNSTGSGPKAGHEESAEAKKLLVKAAGLISALERSLKGNSGDGDWGRERLGEGEMRRRRDLVAQARKEKDDLESLLSLVGKRGQVDGVVQELKSTSGRGHGAEVFGGAGKGVVSKGRVLGKETAKTRELDNTGVLQLQQQMMQDQDEAVDVLTAAVRRQRELATQINEELAVQNDLLGLVEEDVDRVHGKIKVASKRIDKIH